MEMPKSTRPIDRTPFGARLYAARKHANLSQKALGELVGLTQTGVASAEISGEGSPRVARIAEVTGVSIRWLAEDIGPMLPTDQSAPPSPPHQVAEPHAAFRSNEPLTPRELVVQLADLLLAHDHLVRLAVQPLLSRLAEHPNEGQSIGTHIQTLLGGQGNAAKSSSSRSRAAAGR